MRLLIESGNRWLGKIPKEWKVLALKHLCTMQAGKNLVSEQIEEEGLYPVYGGNGQRGYYCKYNCEGEKLVVGRQGALCGNVHKVDGRIWATEHAVITDATSLVTQDFLYYLLIGMNLNQYVSSTAAQPGLAVSTIQNVRTCLPLLSEQERIACFLDAECARIDAVIEQTRASIEEYKKLKQAVITQAVTKGIRPNRPMKDSGVDWIGMVPDDWDCTLLKRHCAFQTGSTPSTANEQWFNGDLDWFTPADFNDKYYLIDSSRKLSLLAREDGVAAMIPQNTVMIIGIGGTAGKIGYTTKECSCNQQITAIKADDAVCPKYLMYWMIANTTRLKDTALYTTLPIINNQTIGQYPFLVPATMEEQVEIADYLDSKVFEIETLIEKAEKIILDIEKYKKSLIFEYITGRKEVM